MENPPIFKFGKPSISINGPWLNHGELLPRGGLHWLAEAVESFGQNLLSHSDLRRRNRPRGFWTARDQEIRDHESWETGAVKKDMKNPCRYSNVIVNIYVYIYIYMYLLFAMIVGLSDSHYAPLPTLAIRCCCGGKLRLWWGGDTVDTGPLVVKETVWMCVLMSN